MGCAQVEEYFASKNIPNKIIYLKESSATVDLAANALGVAPAMIAKTLAFKLPDKNIVIVTSGVARIDNRKFKDTFNCKAKMTGFEETLEITGHPVGGVCPFALPQDVEVYLDESVKAFEFIFPAAGSGNSAVKMTPQELEEITSGVWVDISKSFEE